MSKEMKKSLSRRQFLKNAGIIAGGAAVGAGLLTGCGDGAEVNSADGIEWDRETDVVIIGAGCAGQSAAIEASRAGAEVLMIEKLNFPGGNNTLSAGNAVTGATHVHEQAGIEDHKEWWYEDQMAWGEYRAVPELVKTYTEKGADYAKWLEEMGLVWREDIFAASCSRVPRGIRPAPSNNYIGSRGISMTLVLMKELEKLGVTTLYEHKMKRIYREPNGPVVGVEVENKDGIINIKAKKAVILTSGGFKSNTQMRMAWDPRLDDDLGAGGLPYVETTGEGQIAALNIGAGLTDASFVCEFRARYGTSIYQSWEPPEMTTVPGGAGLGIGDYTRVIMIKEDGQRYVNETGPKDKTHETFWQEYLNLQEKPRNVWAIADATQAAELRWDEEEMRNPQPKAGSFLSEDRVAVADTISELAAKMGVDPQGLEETVKKFNGYVDAGKDPDFGKSAPMYKILTPPFFGAKFLMLAHDQMGGLRANTKGQVLDITQQLEGKALSIDEEKVIPHLYAAGECVGGYVGAERGHGKISIYMIFGRIAGENAAKETPLA